METSILYEGRPENYADRLPKEQRCYDMLDRLGIAYSRVDHEHADTIEACHEIEQTLTWDSIDWKRRRLTISKTLEYRHAGKQAV